MATPGDLAVIVGRTAQRYGLPLPPLIAVAGALARLEPLPDRERAEVLIVEKAQGALRMRQSLAASAPDPHARSRKAALDAFDAGRFAEVDRLLAEIELAIFSGEDDLSAMAADRRVAAGEIRAARALTGLFQFDPAGYREAARRYAEAAAIVGAADEVRSRELAVAQGEVLARIGSEFGERAGFQEALLHLGDVAPRLSETVDLRAWTTAQEQIGKAAFGLYGVTGDVAHAKLALLSYRAALRVMTPAGQIERWLRLQRDFAEVALSEGERLGDISLLDDAVATCRRVAEHFQRDREPAAWAASQADLGRALHGRGRARSGMADLEEAYATTRRAMEVFSRDETPVRWSALQERLGGILATLGAHYRDSTVLEEAVAAFGTALQERTREKMPALWAETLANQGFVKLRLAERGKDARLAYEAARQISSAIEALRSARHEERASFWQKCLAEAEPILTRLTRA